MPTAATVSHCAEAQRYMRDVTSQKLPACQWVQKACQRQLADLERWKHDGPWEFDSRAAERICNFIERLPHIKGIWARTAGKIVLEPWQKFILTTIFGWKSREYQTRRYRVVYIEIPRKNAKSTMTSGVGLYLLACDDEPGAHVVSAAATRDQAKIVFTDAQNMARRESGYRARYGVDVMAHTIIQLQTASKFEAISAEDSNLDGLNIHGALIDELHAHKTRGVWDVLETATGSRAQPLVWAITTAGVNRASVCYDQHKHVKDILSGTVADDTYFGIIYSIDDADDPFSEATWIKANPNYGVSIYPENFKSIAARAQSMPSAQTAFLTKHLNVWVNADVQWLDSRAWSKCEASGIAIDEHVGEQCFIGIDLAFRSDFTAVVAVFPPVPGREKWRMFGRYYLPSETVERSENTHYQGWEREGRIVVTDGAVTDFDAVLDDLLDWCDRFQVVEIANDPYRDIPIVNALHKRNLERGRDIPVVELRQSTAVMSPVMKELEALILSGLIEHDGDPVFAWMLSNVVCANDGKDNIFPRKDSPERKIDGVLALLMALDRAMRREPSPTFDGGLCVI